MRSPMSAAPELSSRFASVKKGDLATSAERVFAGTYITEVEVRERALAWVPEVMRFAADEPEPAADTDDEPMARTGVEADDAEIRRRRSTTTIAPRELAA